MQKIAIETTTMAIREILMEYFKGTCVERLTEGVDIQLFSLPSERQYQYMRRESDNQRRMMVRLNGLPIMTIQCAPERVLFHAKVLNRSPQLREVYKGLKDFMEKYLSGIEVKHSRKGVFYVT